MNVLNQINVYYKEKIHRLYFYKKQCLEKMKNTFFCTKKSLFEYYY